MGSNNAGGLCKAQAWRCKCSAIPGRKVQVAVRVLTQLAASAADPQPCTIHANPPLVQPASLKHVGEAFSTRAMETPSRYQKATSHSY